MASGHRSRARGGAPDEPAPAFAADGRELFLDWLLGRLLGRGGMGMVHEAEHVISGQVVAIKRIPRRVAAQYDIANRFRREARTLGRLRHPNIVSLLGCGIAPGSGDYYLVMELVEGDSFRALIEHAKMKHAARALPVRLALHVMAQVAAGMVSAHAIGIVHRDLKPENIMVRAGGHALILDFGLAKNLAQGRISNLPPDGVKSNPASVLGTPRYMAPEQVRGLDVDERTDVYAMGVCLYEAIAGRSPYRAADETTDPTEIACLHVFAAPTPLREIVPEVPEAVGRIVMRCLSKAPAERPTALVFAAELGTALADQARADSAHVDAEAPEDVRVTEPMAAAVSRPRQPTLPFKRPAAPAPPVPEEHRQRETLPMPADFQGASPTFAAAVADPDAEDADDTRVTTGGPRPPVTSADGFARENAPRAAPPDATPDPSSLTWRHKMRTPPYLVAPLGGLVLAIAVAAVVKTRTQAHAAVAPPAASTTALPFSAATSVPTATATATTAATTAPAPSPSPSSEPPALTPTAEPAPARLASTPPRAKPTPAVRHDGATAAPAPEASAAPPAPAPPPAPSVAPHRMFGVEQ